MDASDTTIGSVLGKEEEKNPYVIYYISNNITPAELNYIGMDKEFVVVVYSINKFHHCIIGYPIFLYTDHSTIRYLANKHVTNG